MTDRNDRSASRPILGAAQPQLFVSDIKASCERLFSEFRSTDVAFHQTLRKEPWGARGFIVKDPDGNLLLFAGTAD